MRIALVTETYFPQINGVSRTLDRLVGFLTGRNDQVGLFIPRYARPAPVLPSGVSTRSYPALPVPFYPEVLLPFATPATLRNELKSFQPDLVHIATEGPLGWAALQAARHLGLPVVSSYHSNFSQYLRQYGFGCLEEACWRYLRWFHNGTQVTFCPTPSIRELLLARGFREVRTWGRGVDSGYFHPEKRDDQLRRQWGAGPDTPVILYVGRLAVEKNVAMLLDAFGLLPADPAPILVLVGDGPLRSRLEKVSGKRVVFAGYRQGEELARSYASADLFVFPSLTDTFGNVLLEGMAAGLPAVGFRVPGPKDVIRPGETGLVVNSVGTAELAEGMKEMLLEPVRRQIMGDQARSFALARSWQAILGSLRHEYERVIEGAGEKSLVTRGETNDGQTGD